MLPRRCLTWCEVPYLCLIACPLNARLEQLVLRTEAGEDVKIDPDEPFNIEIASNPNAGADIQTNNIK